MTRAANSGRSPSSLMWISFASSSLSRIGNGKRDLVARVGLRIEQIALGADRRRERRHQLLADRVERRVRDLREELREVVEQQPRAVGEHRDRRVGAHRADRLVP